MYIFLEVLLVESTVVDLSLFLLQLICLLVEFILSHLSHTTGQENLSGPLSLRLCLSHLLTGLPHHLALKRVLVILLLPEHTVVSAINVILPL